MGFSWSIVIPSCFSLSRGGARLEGAGLHTWLSSLLIDAPVINSDSSTYIHVILTCFLVCDGFSSFPCLNFEPPVFYALWECFGLPLSRSPLQPPFRLISLNSEKLINHYRQAKWHVWIIPAETLVRAFTAVVAPKPGKIKCLFTH